MSDLHFRKSTKEPLTPLHISGLVKLDIQVGDLRMRVTFAFVDDLALPIFIGPAYLDKLSESIQ